MINLLYCGLQILAVHVSNSVKAQSSQAYEGMINNK